MIQKKTLILKTLKFFIEGLKKKSKNTSIRNIVKWSLTFRISHKTNYKNIAREVKKKKTQAHLELKRARLVVILVEVFLFEVFSAIVFL